MFYIGVMEYFGHKQFLFSFSFLSDNEEARDTAVT